MTDDRKTRRDDLPSKEEWLAQSNKSPDDFDAEEARRDAEREGSGKERGAK